ncbi:MAG: ABC transporter ATP-binding protein [Candidatus Rokubacteria bacterium]|nr:ABC transporter ATP-binding protein [Candidatus Rokubacteria bacterium]MBI2155950.1 ABC transporter ATP-binding protein [Candidatus Rokubacteria bacterium]MBI2494110.1 ABC transporter ATP-binding protein [Candidatus Rokubacteria bacterium]MBI4629127.1 ABC transporter ATP-binding protein [Candidatus Rokubacteria bacterium]
MLALDRVTAVYTGRAVLHEVSLRVAPGEIVAMIGANGSGKSTTLKVITGGLRPVGGQVLLDGEPLEALAPEAVVGRGIALVPEGRRVFPRLTVVENLRIGAYSRADRNRYREDAARVFELFPVLAQRARQEAGTLSGGEQQMLAIGRALMARPRWLLLDEPSLGLAPKVIDVVWDAIQKINADGLAVLLVEQKAFAALQLAARAYVLENGRIVAEGPSATLAADPRVKQAYLSF